MTLILELSLYFAQLCTMLAIVFCGIRLLRGPTAQDRVLAMDTLWMCIMIFILLIGMATASLIYFEVALLMALTGFISTVALAKFLMRGEIIE